MPGDDDPEKLVEKYGDIVHFVPIIDENLSNIKIFYDTISQQLIKQESHSVITEKRTIKNKYIDGLNVENKKNIGH